MSKIKQTEDILERLLYSLCETCLAEVKTSNELNSKTFYFEMLTIQFIYHAVATDTEEVRQARHCFVFLSKFVEFELQIHANRDPQIYNPLLESFSLIRLTVITAFETNKQIDKPEDMQITDRKVNPNTILKYRSFVYPATETVNKDTAVKVILCDANGKPIVVTLTQTHGGNIVSTFENERLLAKFKDPRNRSKSLSPKFVVIHRAKRNLQEFTVNGGSSFEIITSTIIWVGLRAALQNISEKKTLEEDLKKMVNRTVLKSNLSLSDVYNYRTMNTLLQELARKYQANKINLETYFDEELSNIIKKTHETVFWSAEGIYRCVHNDVRVNFTKKGGRVIFLGPELHEQYRFHMNKAKKNNAYKVWKGECSLDWSQVDTMILKPLLAMLKEITTERVAGMLNWESILVSLLFVYSFRYFDLGFEKESYFLVKLETMIRILVEKHTKLNWNHEIVPFTRAVYEVANVMLKTKPKEDRSTWIKVMHLFPDIKEMEIQEFKENPKSGVARTEINVKKFARLFKDSLRNEESFAQLKAKLRTMPESSQEGSNGEDMDLQVMGVYVAPKMEYGKLPEIIEDLEQLPEQEVSNTEIEEILQKLDEMAKPPNEVVREWVAKSADFTNEHDAGKTVPQLKKLQVISRKLLNDMDHAFEFQGDDQTGQFETRQHKSFPNSNASMMSESTCGYADSLDSYVSEWSQSITDGERTDEGGISDITPSNSVKSKHIQSPSMSKSKKSTRSKPSSKFTLAKARSKSYIQSKLSQKRRSLRLKQRKQSKQTSSLGSSRSSRIRRRRRRRRRYY